MVYVKCAKCGKEVPVVGDGYIGSFAKLVCDRCFARMTLKGAAWALLHYSAGPLLLAPALLFVMADCSSARGFTVAWIIYLLACVFIDWLVYLCRVGA